MLLGSFSIKNVLILTLCKQLNRVTENFFAIIV